MTKHVHRRLIHTTKYAKMSASNASVSFGWKLWTGRLRAHAVKIWVKSPKVSSDLWRCKKSQQNWYMYRVTENVGIVNFLHVHIVFSCTRWCENMQPNDTAKIWPLFCPNNTKSHKIWQILRKMVNASVKTAHYVSASCKTSHWEVQILKKAVLAYILTEWHFGDLTLSYEAMSYLFVLGYPVTLLLSW